MKIPRKRVSFQVLGTRGFEDQSGGMGVLILVKDANPTLKPYTIVLDIQQAKLLVEGITRALEWKPS